MKDYIEERAVEIANYIIDTKATVRQAAKKFGISKSTVHKDCTDRLSQLNPGLACEVRQVLDVNKQERHIRRVGIAYKRKNIYISIRDVKEAAVGYDSMHFFRCFFV